MYIYFVKAAGHNEVAFPIGFYGIYFRRHTKLRARFEGLCFY
jgi:hypothetical protein